MDKQVIAAGQHNALNLLSWRYIATDVHSLHKVIGGSIANSYVFEN